MFKITEAKGFQITFPNGNTVSVQWGAGNYCDNREPSVYHRVRTKENRESATAEVAAWNDSGWYKLDDSDDVIGWQTPEQVMAILNKAMKGEL